MQRSRRESVDVLIVLMSLVAEGTPQLALQLARQWQSEGLRVEVMVMQPEPLDLQAEFQELGLPLHWIDLGCGLARYWALLCSGYRLCRRLHVRSVMSFPLGWHAFVAIGARLAGARRICAYVGNPPPIWTGSSFRKFKLMVQLGRPFTHLLICCSRYLYDLTLRDFHVQPGEATVIYNSCDLEAFTTTPAPPVKPHQPLRIAMTARLEVHKDQPTLIRAADLLRRKGQPVEVWLIGEGSRRDEYEQLIAELDLTDCVKLLGSRRDVPELLSQCDVFAFQALRDEGFGIALAEAMAARLPIVATDVGACREVLERGRCGLLVAEQNPEAMANGILRLLDEPESKADRTKAAFERAVGEFSVPQSATAYGKALGVCT
jgi:glycosyltransferase involved in cell wall biosynthesis